MIGVSVRDLSSSKANFSRDITGGASYTIYRVFTGAFAVGLFQRRALRYSVSGEYKIPELDNSTLRAGYQSHDAWTIRSTAKSRRFAPPPSPD